MYNAHRGIVGAAPSNRLNELMEQLRQEFDNQSRGSGELEHQIAAQIQELELIQRKIYTLEQQQMKMKQDYETEIRMLRHELEQRGIQQPMGGPPPQHSGPSSAHPPPNLGHGQNNLFGQIMSNPQQGLPPQGDNAPPQALPPQSLNQAPQPAPSQPPQGFGSNYQPGASINGYGSQQPQPTASPGPGKPPNRARGGPGPATPQQNHQLAYPADSRNSPQVSRPNPAVGAVSAWRVGNELASLDFDKLPPHLKRGSDQTEGGWYAVFNPDVPRVLDVDMIHSLEHTSVVCCVRFSADGKYLATGCNRVANIYDVQTGQKVTSLQDESVDKEGDLYIRSVCFSPEGKYLATGAEDKLIRVWDIAQRSIRHIFSGHEQDIYSLDFARNGRHIASGSGDKSVRVWDLDAGQQVLSLCIEDGVTTVAISPDGRLVAAGSLDRSVRVWDCNSGNLVERLEGADGHQDSVYSVAFAPNGRDLVSGSLDKTIKMWELSPMRPIHPGGKGSGKCMRTFEGHKDFVLSVCLTPDGSWVMSGSKDRGVQFWDPITGHAQMMLQGHKNSVISVAPSPAGNLFATGSGDMRARIWSYSQYRPDDDRRLR